MNDPIPPALWQRIKDFCTQGKTGTITMDAKDGHILAWKVTEAGRLDSTVVDKPHRDVL